MPHPCPNHDFSNNKLGGCPQCACASCKENQRKNSLENDCRKYRIGKFKYDNGLNNGQNEQSADFIFFTCDTRGTQKVAIVVELKGGHLEESYDQLIATLNREQNRLLKGYVVVMRSVPKRAKKISLKEKDREKLISTLTKINKKLGYTVPSKVLYSVSSGEKSEELSIVYSNLRPIKR